MALDRRPSWGLSPLLFIMLSLAAGSCSQCPSPPVDSPKGRGGETLAYTGSSGDGGAHAQPALELQSFSGRLLEMIGERDVDNRYASAVMVEVDEPLLKFSCSGALIHPRLVLTAGHCVCPWRKVTLPGGVQQIAITASACARRAQVTAILHEPTAHPDRPGLQIWEREGEVRPHPGFEALLDAQESVLKSHADLAVILLEEPVSLSLPDVPLAEEEVEVGELLTIAGYGNERGLEQLYGTRYFRRGKVKQSAATLGGRGLYEPAGSYFNTSYRGGPCFREREKSRWLVGIVGLGTDQEMSFASAHSYRTWLNAELQHAAADSTAPHKP